MYQLDKHRPAGIPKRKDRAPFLIRYTKNASILRTPQGTRRGRVATPTTQAREGRFRLRPQSPSLRRRNRKCDRGPNRTSPEPEMSHMDLVCCLNRLHGLVYIGLILASLALWSLVPCHGASKDGGLWLSQHLMGGHKGIRIPPPAPFCFCLFAVKFKRALHNLSVRAVSQQDQNKTTHASLQKGVGG